MYRKRRVRRGGSILSRNITLPVPLLLAACSGSQNALDATGDKAAGVAWLFWFFTAVCLVVWVAVIAVLIGAVARIRRTAVEPGVPDAARERRMGLVVGMATATTVLTLIVLTF